jgi:DNA-binding transcriptional LysR family regulator
MDRLASITAFARVVESGGFTAAARRLGISTTTVSDQVQALENALGARLLNRTTRRVSLTEIGREYFERCAQILHDLAEADEVANALQLTPRGQLRVYCHQGIGRFIAPVVTEFLGRYPEVSVDLRTGDVMVDLLQEGFDLAISALAPPDSTLVRRRLAAGRVVLCCAPSYLEIHSTPRRPADLTSHNCLRYPYAKFPDEWHFRDARGNSVVARVSGNLITTSLETMRAAAVAGIGLWLGPPFAVHDLLGSGALVPLLQDYQTPEFEIIALYPHRRHVTAKVRALIEMLVERFAYMERWFDPASSVYSPGPTQGP